MNKLLTYLTLMTVLLGVLPGALAQDPAVEVVETVVEAAEAAPAYADYAAFSETPGFALFTANNVWMMLSAALVFIMHLGFATVETGLTRAKNTTKFLARIFTQFLARQSPDSTQANPVFMKNTRPAVSNTHKVSRATRMAPLVSVSVATGSGAAAAAS